MKPDAEFLRDFEASHIWVVRAAWWLAEFPDMHVTIPEVRLRPSPAERSRYADGGDFLVRHGRGLTYERVEVKHRSVDFTGLNDYPFPTVFVNEAYKLTPGVVAYLWGYIIFNRLGTHVAVVRAYTSPDWVEVRKYDSAQRRECTFLACPVRLAEFHRLDDA